MAKITELKKITKNIKEIAPPKKETLEEEVEDIEIAEDPQNFNLFRRINASSTLAQTEIPKETSNRQRTIEKEDEAEINFKPSYTGGGNPYRENSYTPVGSAESSSISQSRALGERNFNQQNNMIQRREDFSENERSANSSESAYAGQQDSEERARKRRNM